ncbi:hypothetical protein BRPE64_ACDS27770 [Caballeronia insecticola]|uniref:Uncharacterized protein n=1 Tax=Caballeronia insecticola TaxID=758793 RepID=R4WYV0_9BURK|nr:hypothetical protein BRPE64_ACDS27770 [Caballeronia insecticola]
MQTRTLRCAAASCYRCGLPGVIQSRPNLCTASLHAKASFP